MPTCLAFAVAVLLAAHPVAAGEPSQTQSQPPAAPAGASPAVGVSPVGVQLMTVVDHPATLAGQRVQLPPAQVKRVVAPNLVEIGDPSQHGSYRYYSANKYDRLLVLLPSAAAVDTGDLVVVTGSVRSVRGAQLSRQLAGVSDNAVKRYARRALLIADAMTTADGVSLVTGR